MPAPINPETMVLKNNYYVLGLDEGRIWNHYMNNKDKIIKEAGGNPVVLFIAAEREKIVVKRKIDNKPIILAHGNFSDVIHGRIVSISVETPKIKNYILIDIDSKKESTKEESKRDILYRVMLKMKDYFPVGSIRVSNSATGYHVYGYLHKTRSFDMSDIRNAREYFENTIGENKYLDSGEIKLDFSPMYPKGSHTVIGALCRNGLECMDLTKNWHRFRRSDAIID